jgi:hypothetical protein
VSSAEAREPVARGKFQCRGVVVGITQQSLRRHLRSEDGVVKIGLLNDSGNMVSRVQSTDVPRRPLVPLKDPLQPFDVLPTELSGLVPLELERLEPDTRCALVLDISLFLEPQLLLGALRSTHLEKMDYSYARSLLRPGMVMEGI